VVSDLVTARGLSFAYVPGVPVVDGVDFAARAGELVALLGPNGAGKSTLLRLIAGLLRPRSGEVRLGDGPARRLGARARARRVAIVPQGLAALPDVTVRSFVAYGRYAHLGSFGRPTRADREAVARSLAQADLMDLAERPFPSLSGGQRQRALIARALAQESSLFLIDEPTSALDPEHQLAVFDLIAALSCAGRGAVVVTHDINLASQFATRIVLMAAGRLVAEGEPQEVLRREVLEPVYGPCLAYATWSLGEVGERPVVLPWRAAPAP